MNGIATLVLLDESGDIVRVHADAGPLFRELARARASYGSIINYELTDFGTMSSFSVED
jgi:hypothetical protein